MQLVLTGRPARDVAAKAVPDIVMVRVGNASASRNSTRSAEIRRPAASSKMPREQAQIANALWSRVDAQKRVPIDRQPIAMLYGATTPISCSAAEAIKDRQTYSCYFISALG
jgi:hypothetical protein